MDKSVKRLITAIITYIRFDKKTMRRLVMSVISLAIAITAMTTTTLSWFSAGGSKLQVLNFSLDCGKGLRVNDTGTSTLQFSQVNQSLIPASSVDGRNLYFPTDGSDFSSTTSQMTFRSANVGDKNVNYIQIDFTLTAQQDHTALYINDKKTSIKIAPRSAQHSSDDWSIPQAAALRAALWSSTAEDGIPNTPIVFNPSNSTMRTAAVAEVDRATGAFISDGRQIAHAFSEYGTAGLPVATLKKGVETRFSYIVWLEGTDPKCTDKVLNKDIQINLAFSTSWDNTKTIRFKDATPNSWVTGLLGENGGYSLSLHVRDSLETTSGTDFNMYHYIGESSGEWSCNIPGDLVEYISFYLRPTNGQGPVYEFTRDTEDPSRNTYNRGTSRQYIATEASQSNDSNLLCRGHWQSIADSDGAGNDDGGSFDGDDF